ncbi:hypothetical protein [Nonlabens antarcticus]|uniref:hypothetical protein n=1 Tax=Nonlabens antarcticus TaxID=392714 RepID=UPI001891D3C2|nr:hypothetical protein [Nonlabens antarcticus]
MDKDYTITKTVRQVMKRISKSSSTKDLEKIKDSLGSLSEYQFLNVVHSVIISKDLTEDKLNLFFKILHYDYDSAIGEEYYITEGLNHRKPFPRKSIFDPVDKLDNTLNYFSSWQKLIEIKEKIIATIGHEILFHENDINSILDENNIHTRKNDEDIVPKLKSIAFYFESELSDNHFLSQYSDVKNEMINNFRLFNLSKPLNFSNLKFERCFLYCLTFEEWLKRYASYFKKAESKEELSNRKKEVVQLLELDKAFYQPFLYRFQVSYTFYDYLSDEPEYSGDTIESKRWFNENWLPILDPDVKDPRDSVLYKEEIDDFEPNLDYLLFENGSLIKWISNFRKDYFNPIIVDNFKPLKLSDNFSKEDMIEIFQNILIHYSKVSAPKEVKKKMLERIELLVINFTKQSDEPFEEVNYLFDHSTDKYLINFSGQVKNKLRKAIGMMIANQKIEYKSAEDVHHSFALMFKHDFQLGFSASNLKKSFEKVRDNKQSDVNDAILDPQSELILS